MSIGAIIVMAIGIIAALAGMNYQKKGAVWGQPLAIVGAVLAIAAALWNVAENAGLGGTEAAIAREQRYVRVEHKILGQKLQELVPGLKKVAVFVDPMNYYDGWGDELEAPRENLQLTGLKEGLGDGVEIVEIYPPVPKTKKPAAETGPNGEVYEPPMPDLMMELVTKKTFTDALKKAKGCDVFVNLYMLPPGGTAAQSLLIKFFPELKGMKVALSNPGDLQALKAVFKDKGKQTAELIAVVTSKASAIYDDSIPSSDQKAFDKRFALITKDDYETTIDAATKSGK